MSGKCVYTIKLTYNGKRGRQPKLVWKTDIPGNIVTITDGNFGDTYGLSVHSEFANYIYEIMTFQFKEQFIGAISDGLYYISRK